jgi:hypothetical protein
MIYTVQTSVTAPESVAVERLVVLLESVAVDEDANGRTIQRNPWHVKSLPSKQSQCRT